MLANLGEWTQRCTLKEFSLGIRARDAVEQLLELEPKLVGLSVYIWNVEIMTSVATLLKQIRPDITLVIGGPEVSYEWDSMPIFEQADYLIRGEGDLAFADLCSKVLSGQTCPKVIPGGLPPLEKLASPYPHYSEFDLEHGRVVYVEASRGCPFRCHFCLSSLDRSVRPFPLDQFLGEMEALLGRGVRQFKFVDRTFNLKAETSARIMQFFLDRYEEGMFLHFEMIPDRLPDSLKPIIKAFPPGVLQFEVGIQSFDPEVCARIGRRQNFSQLEENLSFLSRETGVHVHADLIVGLPGESLKGFGRGFDRLVKLGPAEIQVGILKRLRGTPITQTGPEWAMTYSREAPYEVLSTSHLTFQELQRLQRFARYWDLTANSGRFPSQVSKLLADQPFENFLGFSDWLYQELGVTHGISARRLGDSLADYLGIAPTTEPLPSERTASSQLPRRQRRHSASLATFSAKGGSKQGGTTSEGSSPEP